MAPFRIPPLRVLGVVLIAAAIAGAAYPIWWNHRSAVEGTRLIERAERQISDAAASPVQAARLCPPASELSRNLVPPAGRKPAGVLSVPAIQLTAPVLAGTSDTALAVAIGHDPSTPWPAPKASSELVAHDVTWFTNIDHLHAGDIVNWSMPCVTLHYEVASHLISHPRAKLPSLPAGELILDTCYPTNALWFTPDRYVVLARYTGITYSAFLPGAGQAHASPLANGASGPHPPQPPGQANPLPFLPISPGLAATNISLSANEVLLGHLTLTGNPAPSWSQSPTPLAISNRAIELYFGAMHAAERYHDHPDWWAEIAPGVPVPSPWPNAGPLAVSIAAHGDALSSVTLCSPARKVVEQVTDGMLLVTATAPGC